MPRPIAKAASTPSWQVKALVLATPISGPAWVGSSSCVSRAMVEVVTLTTAATIMPLVSACRIAASVSAVSPDWLMNRHRQAGSGTGSR